MPRLATLFVALLSAAQFTAPAYCQVEATKPADAAPAATTAQAEVSAGESTEELDPEAKKLQEEQERIERLEKTLSGATLVGRFTDSNRQDAAPRAERYELAAVKHLGKGQWLFKARIRYGEHDLTLPMTLPILWAGDTPIITVDKLPIVGMGSFDARVMIFQDHYAGYWSGGEHHGHIFGAVEPPKPAEQRSQQEAPAKSEAGADDEKATDVLPAAK